MTDAYLLQASEGLDPSVIDMDPNDPAPEGGDEAGAADGGGAQASDSEKESEDEFSD
jgi:hypothetical protein